MLHEFQWIAVETRDDFLLETIHFGGLISDGGVFLVTGIGFLAVVPLSFGLRRVSCVDLGLQVDEVGMPMPLFWRLQLLSFSDIL